MARRGTVINMVDGEQKLLGGEPILDTQEGVLIIAFEDGTSRTFNWDFVFDFYYLTEDEYDDIREGLRGR
jgi:hypothetical protein